MINGNENSYYFLKYRGLVSLFHDIGDPFELAHAQIRTYCEEIRGKDDKNLFVSFGNLNKFILLSYGLNAGDESDKKFGLNQDFIAQGKATALTNGSIIGIKIL